MQAPACMVLGCEDPATVLLVVEPAPVSGAERPYCDGHAAERREVFRRRIVEDRPIRG